MSGLFRNRAFLSHSAPVAVRWRCIPPAAVLSENTTPTGRLAFIGLEW
jgi:hypothetical protein